MPFVRVPRNWHAAADGAGDAGSDTIEIYYEVHGEDDNGGGGGDGGGDAHAGGPLNGGSGPAPQHGGGGADGGSEECESEGTRVTGATRSRPARVLLIMGVAAASRAWAPQFTLFDGSSSARQCIAVDNRGIGRSGSPSRASDYSTEFMARDAIAALAAAGWDAPGERIHIVGHSMGGMIACKVAALLGAERVASLMPISSSLGGGSAFFLPPLDFLLGAAGKMMRYSLMPARKARAKFDLWIHYTDDWLTHRVDHPDEVMHEDGDDGGANDRRAGPHADADSPANEEAPKPLSPSRQSLLREEYIEASANGGEQCQAGLEGQLHAVHSHRMSRRELRAIHKASYPILVVHGVQDQLAVEAAGRALAHRLGKRAKFVALSGAHFCCRENAVEVNSLLKDLCRGGDGSGAQGRAILQRADTLWHRPTYGFLVHWCCCGLGRPRSEEAQVWKARTLRKVALASLFTATMVSTVSADGGDAGSGDDGDDFEDAISYFRDDDPELGIAPSERETLLNPLADCVDAVAR